MLLPQSHPAPRACELWAFAKGTQSCAADPWHNQIPGRSNLGLEQKGLLSRFLWGCHSFTQKRFPSSCSAPGAGTARSQGTCPCPAGACSWRGEWWAGRTRTLVDPGRDSWGLSWLSKGWPWTQNCVCLTSFFKHAHWITVWSYRVGRPARLKGSRESSFCERNIPPELIILHPAPAMAFLCLGCGSHFTPVAVPGAITVTGASRQLSALSCPNTLFSDFRPYWSSL